MKKLFIFIMMLCMVFTLTKGKSYARIEELPVGRNYLDVSTFVEMGDIPNRYRSYTEFRVNRDSVYTLVMSKQAVLVWYAEIENLEIDFTYFASSNTFSEFYQKDDLNERVYVEFIPEEEFIFIESFYLDSTNFVAPYEIILYEGSYDDFFGFEPYINPNDVLKYYGQIKVNYDEPLTTETISTYITAQSPTGVSLNKELSHDTYSPSNKLPGMYELIYETTHNNITKQYFLSVIVEDLTAPTISILEPIRVSLSNKIDLHTLKSQISVTDNVDHLTSQDLVITYDSYTPATSVGIYQITVEATDSSLNHVSQTLDIEIYDNQGPKISGPSQLYLYVGDEALTNNEILSYYKITDDVGVNTSSIQVSHDEYVLNPEPGIYLMTISAEDTTGNVTTKDIHIHVIDNRGPEFHVDDTYIITTTPTEIKSESDIITWLSTKLESEGIQATNISIDHNEYELRASKSGSYYVYMNYQVDDQTYQTRVLVDVVDESGFNLLYLLGIIPICGIITLSIYIYRKRKLKI